MKGNRKTLRLGDLITALYEEIAEITTDKSLQTKLVYIALLDLKISSQMVPARVRNTNVRILNP